MSLLKFWRGGKTEKMPKADLTCNEINAALVVLEAYLNKMTFNENIKDDFFRSLHAAKNALTIALNSAQSSEIIAGLISAEIDIEQIRDMYGVTLSEKEYGKLRRSLEREQRRRKK